MYKGLIICSLLTVFATACAQHKAIKELKPSEVKILTLSKEGEKDFEKFTELINKKNLTEDEDKLCDKYWEIFDETMESYWDTPPGGAGCSWYCAGGPSKIEASSELKQQGGIKYGVENIHDFSYEGAWVEGVKGYGVGEYIVYTFEGNSPRVTEVIIANGYVKSEKAWRENSRVKKMMMYYDGKPYAILNLEDSRSDQTFKLGEPLGHRNPDPEKWDEKGEDWTLKFEILEVYEGDKYDDTAISELYFNGLDVHCLVAGTKIEMADGSVKNIEDIKTGDLVRTPNGKTGARVEGTAKERHGELVTYKLESGKSITATQDHPVKMADESWASYSPEKTKMYKGYESARKIKRGDMLMTSDGAEKLIDIVINEKEQTTYTITKLDSGNAFIANGIVVGTEELK